MLNYYRVYKPVLKEIGVDAALYYGYLINQKEYREKQYQKNINNIDFFVVRPDIEKATGLGRKKQLNSEQKLERKQYITIIPKSYEGNRIKFNPLKINQLKNENYICVYHDLIHDIGYEAAILYGIINDIANVRKNEIVEIDREVINELFNFGYRTRKKYEQKLKTIYFLSVINNTDKHSLTYKVALRNIKTKESSPLISQDECVINSNIPLPPTNDKNYCSSIVKRYNKIMNITSFSEKDVDNCMAHYEKIKQIEPLIDDFLLPYIWDNLTDSGTRAKVKPENRRISAFISFGLLDNCVNNIDSLVNAKDESLLDKLHQIYDENYDLFNDSKPEYIPSLFNGSIYITDYTNEYDYPEYCHIKRMVDAHNDIGIVWYVMNKSIDKFPKKIKSQLQKVECPKKHMMKFYSKNDEELQNLNDYTINYLWDTYAPDIQDKSTDNFIHLHLIDVAVIDKEKLNRKLLEHIRNELLTLIDIETLKANLPEYFVFSDNQLRLSSALERDSPLGKKLLPLWLEYSAVEWEISVFYYVLKKVCPEKMTHLSNYRAYIPTEISAIL